MSVYPITIMSESILIVDDNQMTRDSLQALLLSAGYKADTCEDGAHAIDAAKARPYDAFIVDYRMPNMLGDELTRLLRSSQPEAFIIGYSIENREQAFRSAGADTFLIKDNLAQWIVLLVRGRFQLGRELR